MRTSILPAGLALAIVLAFAPSPARAGGGGWHAGGSAWSLPAGARFAWSGRGSSLLAGGFGGHPGRGGRFVRGQPPHHGWPGMTGHGAVLVSPSLGRPVIIRDGRRFFDDSGFGVRRFDRVNRTVVIFRVGDGRRVPAPGVKAWRHSRSFDRLSWD